MLIDFSVDWRWVVGGTDVSPHVETWELAREQPDMGTPAWWRGKLVLRPVVGRDLNLDPLTNSLWRQGTSCSLTVAGYLVFTGSVLLAYYDDWSTAPRLELEVGDVLAAKNHRQVIPFGEYDPLSLLRALRIPGDAPWGDKVEISTDLTSPVKVLQELTWVARLKWGLPATLFTLPSGSASYASPQSRITLTRTLEQVSDFTRQRPALEIPGSVIASASLAYLIQLPAQETREETGEEIGEVASEGDERPDVLVARSGSTITLTYLDSLGRVVREEIYKPIEITRTVFNEYGNPIGERTYTDTILSAYTNFQYYVDSTSYSIIKEVFSLKVTFSIIGGFRNAILTYKRYERTKESGERFQQQGSGTISNKIVQGEIVAKKTTIIYWPGWRFFPNAGDDLYLAYFIKEYSFLGRAVRSRKKAKTLYILRLLNRALGTTQDADTFNEAIRILPTVTEILPNQQIQFPDWVEQFWNPPTLTPAPAPESVEPDEPPNLPVIERIAEALSEEVSAAGFTGPPVYLTVPWLSVTVDEQPGSLGLELRIKVLREKIIYTLRAAARWTAIEIAGRAFARRIKMPPPPEWLGDPRPWTLARIGNEVFWLVGETLRGTGQGVEFEATGILAGRPNTIPSDAFPPGMIPPGTIPPDESAPGLFPPGTIPSFIPLITVSPTRFPQVGIGCEMKTSEVSIIPGDPWLGMAVEIEHAVSAPEGLAVGIGWMEIPAAGLGLAADATYEITGDEEEDDGEAEGLTLEAENGEISGGAAVIVYDADASSCYAVEAENSYFVVDLSVDSTSLNWERPLRIRVIYKAEDEGEIYVYTIQEESSPYIDSWEVSTTTGYVSMDLIIPAEAEPFDGIRVEVNEYLGKIRIDAIQLAPATGDWPPLNPCSN